MIPNLQRIFCVLALAGIVVILSGCAKIKNPNPDIVERHSLVFFNYTIPGKILVEPFEPPATRGIASQFRGAILKVSIPDNYLFQDILDAFTEESGAFVQIIPYDSDVELYELIAGNKAGDVVLAPDYLVELWIKEQRLQKLDLAHLPNLQEVAEDYRYPSYDPIGAFAVPYDWTTAGFAYDTTKVDRAPVSWSALFKPAPTTLAQPRGRIALTLSEHRTFDAALIFLGKPFDTDSIETLRQAAAFLKERITTLKIRLLTVDQLEHFSDFDIAIAQTDSGIAAQARSNNPDVAFVVPDDGTWITIGNFVIPVSTNSTQKVLSQIFINFLLQPRVAAHIVNHSLRASTVTEATRFIDSTARLGPTYVKAPKTVRDYTSRHTSRAALYRVTLWKQILKDLEDHGLNQAVPPTQNPAPANPAWPFE